MRKSSRMSFLLPFLVMTAAYGQDDPAESCASFPWDVSAIVAAYAEGVESARAGSGNEGMPVVELERAYELALSPQAEVTFGAGPERPTLDDDSWAGMVRFQVPAPGRYLAAITSTHWIDVIDGEQLLQSGDFRGSAACARPRKIVEFDLPAERDLVLQLSGGTPPQVGVVIAPAIPLGESAAE